MAQKPPKPCTVSGCPGLDYGDGCPYHPHSSTIRCKDHRPSAAHRGYGYHWRTRIRKDQLDREPFCRICGQPGLIADHIIPRRKLLADGVADPDAEYRLQTLCRKCDNKKKKDEKILYKGI